MQKTDNTPNGSFARSATPRCAYCGDLVASYCVGKNLAGEDVHVHADCLPLMLAEDRQEQQARQVKNRNGSTNAAPRIAETAAIVAAPPLPLPAVPPIAPEIPHNEKSPPRKGNADPYVDLDHPEAVYLYRDASGKVLYRNVRYAVMAADGSPHINPRGKQPSRALTKAMSRQQAALSRGRPIRLRWSSPQSAQSSPDGSSIRIRSRAHGIRVL
jgi:hypothetical protein